jgi:hypothetical protein
MTLSTLVGIVFAIVVIYILYKREINAAENSSVLQQTKVEHIHPTPTHLTKYDDLTDLIFSIQDFHIYNPQSYEDMINAIDTMMETYEYVLLDNSLAGDYFSIAEAHKLLAINALHSIIMTIPSNKNLIDKFNESMKVLEELLNNYLYIIYQKNDEYIKSNGYFNNTKIPDLKISPHNKFEHDTITTSFDYYN